MPQSNLIAMDAFCTNHQIDYSFVQLLHQNGLIETRMIEQTVYIPEDQLPSLERMVRLHFDMDINIEGIETITHLLERIEEMQQEIIQLKNLVGVYEHLL